ncbi:MAG: ribonuclease III [Bacteroidales bacterium]|nr:ribonuclease III [Bacteroidales bacterium]
MFRRIPSYKFLFNENRNFYFFIKDLIGYFPKDINVFREALVHKSASNYIKKYKNINNERLEYLGDSILDSVIADFLYNAYPYKNEGFLTKMRSRIVSRDQLNELAETIGLNRYVIKFVNSSIIKNIYGNALEALIGAVYIDGGFERTKCFIVKKIIRKHIDLNDLKENDTNYKSQLIEWAQKNKENVIFEDFENNVNSNIQNKKFSAKIKSSNQIIGKGSGKSKKEAQQNAAHQALNNEIITS